MSAAFPHSIPIFSQAAGEISHRYGREGVTWKRSDVSCWSTLRDAYYSGMDSDLESISPPADGMAQMIRNLYMKRW